MPPPDHQWPPADGGGVPRPLKQPPFPLLQISGYVLHTKRVMLIDFQVLESYNEKLLNSQITTAMNSRVVCHAGLFGSGSGPKLTKV